MELLVKKSVVLVVTLSILVVAASSPSARAEVAVETDPSTFVFGGFAAHVRWQPPRTRWVASLGGYAMNFPGFVQSLALRPAPSNTDLRLSGAIGLFVDRYLTHRDHGLFVGAQLAHHWFDLHDTDAEQHAHYTTILAMPRVGYRYNLRSGIYLLAWAGLGYVLPRGTAPTLAAQAYTVKPLLPFATLHLGYAF